MAMDSYNKIVRWYAEERSQSTIGIPEVRSLLQMLDKGARILDVGCGTGVPIGRYITQQNQFSLFGIDSSAEMVALFRENLPEASVQCVRIQESDFFSLTFDAAISWGVLFHLLPEDQENVLAKIAGALKVGGYLLFTSGQEEDGERKGVMDGVEFSYFSLGREKYERILSAHGLTMLDEHFDEGENYYYLAQKITPASNVHSTLP